MNFFMETDGAKTRKGQRKVPIPPTTYPLLKFGCPVPRLRRWLAAGSLDTTESPLKIAAPRRRGRFLKQSMRFRWYLLQWV